MMSFRKPQQIKRTTQGNYVNGIWVDGSESIIVISASVQPVKTDDIATLPEGKRLSDYVKLYTSTELQILDEINGLVPDRLLWLGYTYECIAFDAAQMGVISHFKYIFSKLNQQ